MLDYTDVIEGSVMGDGDDDVQGFPLPAFVLFPSSPSRLC
jgi:hypothetical protein